MAITQEQLQEIMQAALGAVSTQLHTNSTRVKAPERPDVDLGFSETQWAFFEDEWKLYKRRAALGADQINDELRSCCSKELRRTLFDFVGGPAIDVLTEYQLLKKIQGTAVIGKNKAVHRKEFYELVQAPDELLNRYVAKLKAKAQRCNFTMECTSTTCDQIINYGEEMLKDQMTTGLYDKEVQQEVLAKDKELNTFQDIYERIEAYEQGKRAKSELQSSVTTVLNAARSQYKRMQSAKGGEDKLPEKCIGCGGKSHGFRQREKKCPAWGKKCFKCGKPNHLSKYCCSTKVTEDSSAAAHANVDPGDLSALAAFGGAIPDTQAPEHPNTSYFYSFSSELQFHSDGEGVFAVPHIEWDGEKFCKAIPPPLPSLEVRIKPLIAYHAMFMKIDIDITPNTVDTRAFTDTCAQTCVAGREILKKVNMAEKMLIRTSHKIKGVTNQYLRIIGLLLVEISFKSGMTYAVVYVCDNVNGVFLSESVQKRLGVISTAYPNVSRACAQTVKVMDEKASLANCGCPCRVNPPPPPASIPFPPTKENRGKLQEWIVETYSSSGFNTCEHQQIRKLTGEPLDIHWRDGVRPVACYTPVPVPLHFKDQVKEDLDRDVRIGVLEPVPQGTPTVWCSRMLVTSKKSGKPRRVVDYQAVNKSSLRETHHTPTPFQLASSVPANMLKTLFDAWNGYHALPLTEKAKNALTFFRTAVTAR